MLAFARLSISLLVSSVILALPVQSSETELLVLTPDNFESTIADGVWFIEHFSPYCGHCRKFAPTWTQLVQDNDKKSDPGIYLAQVNCAINGDLCTKNKVDGYPQMNLYRNGQFVEIFRQARDYDLLTGYITAHAEPRKPPLPPAPEPTPESVPAPKAEPIVPEKDVLVQEVVLHVDVNPTGTVLSLNETNFHKTVEKGHVFVKFFAPWCGHCKKLAPLWTQLGGLMQHKLTIAEVNCEDHGALCRAVGISGYPMLYYYAGKNENTEYTGGRKLEQLKAFADKVSGPGVQELNFSDLETCIAEHSVLYLFLHSPNDRSLFTQVVEASNVLFGSPPLFASTSRSFYDHFAIEPGSSVILVLKDYDFTAPAAVHTLPHALAPEEKRELSQWFIRNRLASAVELDSDNFQEVMNAPHKPLVVIAATSQPQMKQTAKDVTELARKWRDAKSQVPVVFTWMDADKWGKWLKSMYGVKASALPRSIVANHSTLVYYDVDPFGETVKLTSASLFPTINAASQGTLAYKHSENLVERMVRFLNNQLISLESYIFENPWYSGLFALTLLIMVILGLKRLLADSEDSREGGYLRKGDRAD